MANRILAVRPVDAGLASDTGRLDRVLIRDLTLMARIGIHPHEREPQRVRINAEVEFLGGGRLAGDDGAGFVCYETIVGRIKDTLAAGHIALVETLAERVAEICLADARTVRARVRVEKLDIEPDAAAVGVEIERAR